MLSADHRHPYCGSADPHAAGPGALAGPSRKVSPAPRLIACYHCGRRQRCRSRTALSPSHFLERLVAAGILLGGSLGILQFNISTVFAQIVVLIIAIVGLRMRPIVAERIGKWRDRRPAVDVKTPSHK